MTLVGGILMSFFASHLAAELLRRGAVGGFLTTNSAGYVVLATLGFHGAAIVAAFLFLKFHGISWREVSGLDTMGWKRQLVLVAATLLLAAPAMLALKAASDISLQKLGWPVEHQRAVELILNCKGMALKIYLGVFAVIIAPVAEEFVFRGLIFSAFKKAGWTVSGWLVTSLLFALIHGSAPVFLPLFVFALALTWLYEKTGGLLAPVVAHSAFNAANLGLLYLAEEFARQLPNQT